MTTAPPGMTELLARWGIPARADLVRAERGTNNQTFAVVLGRRRWALRISENLTAEQVHAEHRLLTRLCGAGLPFAVPEPVPTLAGDTVTDTPAGPATLCRWLPGVRPELAEEQALARFGRAIGLLSEALRNVPLADAPHDWRGDPLGPHPEMPGVAELARQLSPEHAALLEAGLTQSGALDGAGWQPRVAALMRGHASALPLSPAEIQAIPPLLICRCIGSIQWRAGRWHRGQAELIEVIERLGYLAETMKWLDTSGEQFLDVIARTGR
jgi:homoserine kinase type II